MGKIEDLIVNLQNKDPAVREKAIYALGHIRDYRVIKPLIAALKDEDPHVREEAARGLPRVLIHWKLLKQSIEEEPHIVDLLSSALIEAAKDENPEVRQGAVASLGTLWVSLDRIGVEEKDPHIIESLILALKDKNEYVRVDATTQLAVIKDPRAVEPLISVLKDDNAFAREWAARGLGRISDPHATEPLKDALKREKNQIVKDVITSALVKLGEIEEAIE